MWHAVAGAVDDIKPDFVTKSLERVDKVVKHLVLGNGRDVLHRDYIWPGAFCQTSELVQKPPFAVLAIQLIALRIGGKRLTRSTPCKDLQIGIAEKLIQLGGGDFADISLYEFGAVVSLIGKTAGGVHVDARNDRHAFEHEAMRQPANSTEQVNTGNRGHS